jgi:hypothetical protein
MTHRNPGTFLRDFIFFWGVLQIPAKEGGLFVSGCIIHLSLLEEKFLYD